MRSVPSRGSGWVASVSQIMKTSRSGVTVILIVILMAISGCKHQRVRSPTEKHYELKGKVIQVDKDQHSVTVEHEDIKGYMPAMTMPFNVAEEWWWVFDLPLAPGDQITATLVVDGVKSWLEDVVISKEGTDTVTPAGAESIGPKEGEEVPNYRLINQEDKPIRIHDYR